MAVALANADRDGRASASGSFLVAPEGRRGQRAYGSARIALRAESAAMGA
jgi:hypothetical protein